MKRNHSGKRSFHDSDEESEEAEIIEKKIRSTAEVDIVEVFLGYANCCSRSTPQYNCILQQFLEEETGEVSLTSAVQFIRYFRQQSRGMGNNEFALSMKDRYVQCLNTITSQKHQPRYKLENINMGVNIQVCRKSFAYAYGCSEYGIKKISDNVKGIAPLTSPRPFNDRSRDTSMSYDAMEEMIYDNVVTVNSQGESSLRSFKPDSWQISCSILAESLDQQNCFLWLHSYFQNFGDHMPNRSGEIRLSSVTKFELYCEYEAIATSRLKSKPVSYAMFVNIWNRHFPKVTIRTYVDIPGKCSTCNLIETKRKSLKGEHTLKMLSKAHSLHRFTFMSERTKYRDRCLHAINNRGRIMSLIIDGMDQQHCKIPHLGTQNSFNSPIHQLIMGAKCHDDSLVTLYRCFGTVSKGANLAIYCILDQIVQWEGRHGISPEILYVQLDGGSENANKWVLMVLELLVIKRVVRVAYFNRLPVGHTHADIDAIFGNIWKAFRGNPCLTVEDYTRIIMEAFTSQEETGLKVKVKDVSVVPNFQAVVEGCVDANLSKLHKEEYTQHQFRFEAVTPSSDFPFGCKVTYRAYSSDYAIELRHRSSTFECLSEVGQYTELEPVGVYCQWYPTSKCDFSRPGVEGFYLVRKLPDWQTSFPNRALFPAQALPENCVRDIANTVAEVNSRFSSLDTLHVKESWNAWKADYAPTSQDIDEYITRQRRRFLKAYERPLCEVLFRVLTTKSSFGFYDINRWAALPMLNNTLTSSDTRDDAIPPDVLALASHSVQSDFNPSPFPPRLYLYRDSQLALGVNEFKSAVKSYYTTELKRLTQPELVSILKRKVTIFGAVAPTSGTKHAQCDRICKDDAELFTTVIRRLNPALSHFVTNLTRQGIRRVPTRIEQEIDSAVFSIGETFQLGRKTFIQFGEDAVLKREGVEAALRLFAYRDYQIFERRRQDEPNDNTLLKPSYFCYAQNVQQLVVAPGLASNNCPQSTLNMTFAPVAESGDFNLQTMPLRTSDFYRLYLVLQLDSSEDSWILALVDCLQQSIFFIDPKHDIQQGLSAELIGQLKRITLRLLTNVVAADNGVCELENWAFGYYPYSYHESQKNSCDSGISVMIALYQLVNQCPVYFSENIVISARENFAHWLSKGSLPR